MRHKLAASLFFGAAAVAVAQEPVLRYVPKHEELKYTFGGVAPTHRIKPGTRIVTWTEDCYDGAVRRPGDIPSKVQPPGHDNPQTGPFFVEGAEPGDTLAVRIEKLGPARDHGISSSFPGFGALTGTDRTAILGPDLPETVWFYEIDRARGVARTRSQDGKHSWEVPLAPFLGCLGVSPANGEARSTIVPDDFGGNMDCPEVRAGNTVYLGVRVPGALLSFGDGHYAMGDGEIIGTAIEGAMNVELTVELLKKREDSLAAHRKRRMDDVARGRPAARGRRADRVQGHGALGTGEDRFGRDGRLPVRLPERAGADRRARRPGVHRPGQDPEEPAPGAGPAVTTISIVI